MKAALYACLIFSLLITPGAGVDPIRAGALYEGCKQLVSRDMNRKLFDMGACAGAFNMLWELRTELPHRFQFCPPPDAHIGDAVEIVVSHLSQHKPRLQEKFLDVARAALAEAWPCER